MWQFGFSCLFLSGVRSGLRWSGWPRHRRQGIVRAGTIGLLRRISFLLALTAALAVNAPSFAASQPGAFQSEQQMSYRQLMQRWDPLIAEASQRFGVPEIWIRSVMQAESGGRTMSDETHPITSGAGAM